MELIVLFAGMSAYLALVLFVAWRQHSRNMKVMRVKRILDRVDEAARAIRQDGVNKRQSMHLRRIQEAVREWT